MASEQEKRLHRCCFTGHRPEKLEQSEDEIREWLTEQIENAIDDGYLTFISGMAMGVDIWAGEPDCCSAMAGLFSKMEP